MPGECQIHAGLFNPDVVERIAKSVNMVFANSEDTEEIYPLTIAEIAEAQHADKNLCKLFKHWGEKLSTTQQYQLSLIENTTVITTKSLQMAILEPLRFRAVQWYHYYLQHPGHTRLEETIRATMT